MNTKRKRRKGTPEKLVEYPTLSVQSSVREILEKSEMPVELQGQGLMKAYFIVSTINHEYWGNRKLLKNRLSYLRLSSQILKKTIGSDYNAWITLLCEKNIIERLESYQTSGNGCRGKCKGFRVNPELAGGFCEQISIFGPNHFPDRINAGFEKSRSQPLESVGHELIRKNTYKLQIRDETAAMFILHFGGIRKDDNWDRDCSIQTQMQNIRVLSDGFRAYKPTDLNRSRIKVDAHGRFYSPFTNLMGDLRSQVTLDFEHLTGVDIHASHWFHALMLWPDRESDEGRMLLRELVEGDFYDFLISLPSIPWTVREDLKTPSLAFLHSHHQERSTDAKIVSKAIRKVAPSFWKWLNEQKAGDVRRSSHKAFSHSLMREESDRVIVDTVGRLAEVDPDYPVVTIHDALYVPHGKASEALEVFKGVYQDRYGIVPRIKVEKTDEKIVSFEEFLDFS